jgi:hypothetical protein
MEIMLHRGSAAPKTVICVARVPTTQGSFWKCLDGPANDR